MMPVQTQQSGVNICMPERQQEELRQRLFLVKNRLLSECSEEDHLSISNSFTNTAFEILIKTANIDQLKIGKTETQRNCIELFGKFFSAELEHFH